MSAQSINALLDIVASDLLHAVHFEYAPIKGVTVHEHEYPYSKQLTVEDLKALATRLNVIATLIEQESPDA